MTSLSIFRFHSTILLIMYSSFGKEIKINGAIKSKDNITVFFLYIYVWLSFFIADISMWKVHSLVQFFLLSLPFGYIIRKTNLFLFSTFKRNMRLCTFLYLEGFRICENHLGSTECLWLYATF